MKQTITIKDIFERYNSRYFNPNELQPPFSAQLNYTLSYVDNRTQEVNSYTFTHDDFFNELEHFYSWRFNAIVGVEKTTDAEKFRVFMAKLNVWLRLNNDRYSRIYQALNTKYNPLENYDKHSTIDTSYGKVDTTKNDTMTNGERNDSSVNGARNITNNNNVATFDDANTTRESDSATNQAQTTDTYKTGAQTNTSSGTESVGAHADNVTELTYGNIGVTTNAQMGEGELAYRKHELLKMLVADFVGNICYLYEDIEDIVN